LPITTGGIARANKKEEGSDQTEAGIYPEEVKLIFNELPLAWARSRARRQTVSANECHHQRLQKNREKSMRASVQLE
jgi:hypothetical protein